MPSPEAGPIALSSLAPIDLAAFDAAAAQQDEHGPRVVVAAGAGLILGVRPNSPVTNTAVSIENPFGVERQKRPDRALSRSGSSLDLEVLEVILVRVPSATGNGHELDARLDQSRGQQAALGERAVVEQSGDRGRFSWLMSKASRERGELMMS